MVKDLIWKVAPALAPCLQCFNHTGSFSVAVAEVCPFCGKTYKRLKSHLPHCKAAASSKTPPTKHHVTATQTTPPSQLTASLSSPTAKCGESNQTQSVTARAQSKKTEKVSVVLPLTPTSSLPVTPLQSAHTSSPSPASLKPSIKKTKQKLSEQIKAANLSSSTTIPLNSTVSLPPTTSKPKKKSLRALIEAAKSEQVSNAALEGTTTATEDLTSASAPPSSRTTTQTETKANPDKDNVQPAVLSTDAKPKGASKIKVSKTKTTNQSLSTTKDTSSSQKLNEINTRPVNEMLLRSGSGHQPRITLQDVKATLGRANALRRSSRPSILSQIETMDDLSNKVRPGAGLSPVSISLTRISNHHLLPLAPQTLPARAETLRADDGLTMEKLQAEIRRQNTADNGSKGALTLRTLGQVRLRELPKWLSYKTPKHPRDMVEMVQRGWQWYYRRYIDVKKGGVGGLGMLLAGYCALSYIWSYPHIKRDRWRKYH
ncbi:hypothetical protein L3Q82_010206 [Scortum barcoo]|uniref:Uncharacterized protein n=1 Tax=Scortum barcoo TaxID=214431 RepID=A0ACB8WBE2_9TELE|nr:hypothetical protein L3Q82_010206 [Scortum barcoo]